MEGEEGWWEAPAGQFGAAELGVEVWLAGLHRGDALGPAGASWAPGGFWARGGGATTSPPALRPWREVVAGLEGLPRSHRLAHLDQLETLVRLSPDIAAAKLSLCLPREGTPDALPGGEHPLQDLAHSEWLHGFALLVRARGAGGGGLESRLLRARRLPAGGTAGAGRGGGPEQARGGLRQPLRGGGSRAAIHGRGGVRSVRGAGVHSRPWREAPG